MAEVFLAQDTSVAGMERLVVIKRVLPHLARQQRFISMFLDEARLTARLTHPNIAQLYEVGEDGQERYVVIEFVHGADVSTLLKTGAKDGPRVPFNLVALICARVADALHYAHSLTDLAGTPLHVVHRDISPQNIRISYEGVPKVIDFGIAKSANNVEVTDTGLVKGKYGYLSPEQLEGKPFDGRSDIFALGVVMFELLSYKRLFRRESTAAALHAIVAEPIPSFASCGITAPAALEEIVQRALQRDPADRYANAREMQADLELFMRSSPASAADLEHFMAAVFGDPKEKRRELALAIQRGALSDVFEGITTGSRDLSSARNATQTGTPTILERPGKGSGSSPSAAPSSPAAGRRNKVAHRGLYFIAGAAAIVTLALGVWFVARDGAKQHSPAVSSNTRSDAANPPTDANPSDGQAESRATLIINTAPPGARISIDGEPLDKTTPAAISGLSRDKQLMVGLQLQGYVELRQIVTFDDKHRVTINHRFVRKRPLADGSSTGSVNGRAGGTAHGSETSGSAKEAKPPSKRRRPSGYLTIDTRPWSKVYLDGRSIGITPIVKHRIPAGRHVLSLRTEEKRVKIRIRIAPGQHVKKQLELN
jgi:serine/threonine protein kinase